MLRVKWQPDRESNTDGLTLTKNRRSQNVSAHAENGRIIFDPSMSTRTPLANVFRVFVTRDTSLNKLALRKQFQITEEEVEVYTDGSCYRNGHANARAGSGVWFGENDERNAGVRVPLDAQTNQTAEIYAVALAHRLVPPFAPLHIVSDSKYVVEGLTANLPGWEDRGWIGVANATVMREVVALLRSRCAPTTLRWVKGHDRVRGNEEADRLAALGAELPQQMRPLFRPPPPRFNISGAALCSLSQRLAYKGIRATARLEPRKTTVQNVMRLQAALLEDTGMKPTPENVWRALRAPVIGKKPRDFVWKALHGAHRVGKYWEHIPGYEQRAVCPECGVTESLDHILLECSAPGQDVAWGMAMALL